MLLRNAGVDATAVTAVLFLACHLLLHRPARCVRRPPPPSPRLRPRHFHPRHRLRHRHLRRRLHYHHPRRRRTASWPVRRMRSACSFARHAAASSRAVTRASCSRVYLRARATAHVETTPRAPRAPAPPRTAHFSSAHAAPRPCGGRTVGVGLKACTRLTALRLGLQELPLERATSRAIECSRSASASSSQLCISPWSAPRVRASRSGAARLPACGCVRRQAAKV